MKENNQNIGDMWEAADDEYLKFDRIPDELRPSLSGFMCALHKIESLLQNGYLLEVAAEHDTVYLNRVSQLLELMSEDVVYLQRCGVHYDSGLRCLYVTC